MKSAKGIELTSEFDARKFEVRSDEEDVRIVSLAFDLVLCTDVFLSQWPSAVLHAYDAFLRVAPATALRWYRTENMSQHKPVTPRVKDMLRSWLSPGAPPREIINIELRDGDDFVDTADFSFFVYGSEASHIRHPFRANMIRLSFPAAWGIEHGRDVLRLASEVCERMPFQSGHVGFVLQKSAYVRKEGETQAWRLGMRYPCLDIANEGTDTVALRDAVKGVGWATLLSDAFISRLGGSDAIRAALPDSVDIERVVGGLMLIIGPAPTIGDVDAGEDISAYKAVYRLIEPLQRAARDRYSTFKLPGNDYVAKTQRWLMRLADD